MSRLLLFIPGVLITLSRIPKLCLEDEAEVVHPLLHEVVAHTSSDVRACRRPGSARSSFNSEVGEATSGWCLAT